MRLYFLIARRRYDHLTPIAMLTIDLIDILFIVPATVYGSSYLWLAAAVQYIARRWSVSALGFLLTWGLQPTAFWCQVFPGAARYVSLPDQAPDDVMSSADQPSVPVPVLLEAVPGIGTSDGTATEPDNLTEDQEFRMMALAKDSKGKWRHSGKKLYTVYGGNHAEFLARLRQLRGDDRTEQPEEPTVYTPIAHRPTKASYYENEPELEFRPPPRRPPSPCRERDHGGVGRCDSVGEGSIVDRR